MENLNEAWVLINKENEQIPWPEVHKYTLSLEILSQLGLIQQPLPREPSIDTLMTASDTAITANSAVAPTTWAILQGDAGIEHQDRLHADLKLRFNGGNGVGPV